MRKYRLRNEFGIIRPDGTVEKDCSLQLIITESGFNREEILKLFNEIISTQAALLYNEEDSGLSDRQVN